MRNKEDKQAFKIINREIKQEAKRAREASYSHFISDLRKCRTQNGTARFQRT